MRNLPRLYPEREGYTVVEADNGLDALVHAAPADELERISSLLPKRQA